MAADPNAPRLSPKVLDRRTFLAMLAATGAAGCSSSSILGRNNEDGEGNSNSSDSATSVETTAPEQLSAVSDHEPPEADLSADPFTLGVASGDPDDTSVILWTRLAPDPLAGGGMGENPVDVLWEVAEDTAFRSLVANGIATATARFGHSLHIEVGGLNPNSELHYRFRIGEYTSPVGVARTTPRTNAIADELRIAVASCQSWQAGYYNAYAHLIEEDLDLVLFIGDYIYEFGDSGDEIRPHGSSEVNDLDGYRNRYALYRSDPLLQAAHAKCPWVVTWDDHEVENNYAGDNDENGSRPDLFLRRRADAYQAYYEHMPLRLPPPEGTSFPIHRKVQWGALATFLILDTRQFRDEQVCSSVANLQVANVCEEMTDSTRTMLGSDQLLWMADELDSSSTTWNVLAQQVVMAPVRITLDDLTIVNNDQWDGYPAERQRVLDTLVSTGVKNPIVLTGDIHLAGAANLIANPDVSSSEVVATEFICTGLTSPFPSDLLDLVGSTIRTAPNVLYTEAEPRGYLSCTITPDRWTTEFRFVETVEVEGAELIEGPTWSVTAGTAGATKV